MNSKQRRKYKRLKRQSAWNGDYPLYKNDPRCKAAILEMQKSFPDFKHCGRGKGGYIMLICNDCPARQEQ